MPRWSRLGAALLGLLFVGCGDAGREEAAVDAVVVELARSGLAADRAGLAPGDRLRSWSRTPSTPPNQRAAAGAIDTLFELFRVEVEEAPRGDITLHGERDGQARSWVLPRDRWSLLTRPDFEAAELTIYEQGLKSLAAGEMNAAGETWRAAAKEAEAAGRSELSAWWHHRLARALVEAGALEEAVAELKRAVELVAAGEGGPAHLFLLERLATLEERSGRWNEAETLLERARNLAARQEKDGLTVAWFSSRLAFWAGQQEKNGPAGAHLERALPIFERKAPGSSELAAMYNRVGIIARRTDRFEQALEYFERCDKLLQSFGPGTVTQALCAMNRGNTYRDLGELRLSEESLREAVTRLEALAPSGSDHLLAQDNLAGVFHVRGELAAAETLYLKVLASMEAKKAIAPAEQGIVMVKLGLLNQERRNLAEADRWLLRALEVLAPTNTASDELASAQQGLAGNAARRGDFATARRYQRQAVATREEMGRDSLGAAFERIFAAKLELDAALAEQGGDLEQVVRDLRRELAVFEAKAPGSREAGVSYGYLAEALLAVGRAEEALRAIEQTLALFEALIPGSDDLAEALHQSGRVLAALGRDAEARESFCRATLVLEQQRPKLGGSAESRVHYEAGVEAIYWACQEAQVAAGDAEAAFATLERGRARAFLALLAERDLKPIEMTAELASERARLDAEYDRGRAALAGLSAEHPEIPRYLAELAAIRQRQRSWEERARATAPRALRLESSAALNLEGVRAVLDPGTVLLAYAVGEESSRLFVVAGDGEPAAFSTWSLPVGRQKLSRQVEALRRGLETPGVGAGSRQRQQRVLGELLLAPAAAAIARAEQVLISPTGPLNALPLSVLNLGDRLLVERVPVHTVLSATVYAELLAARREGPLWGTALAFGDPAYPAAAEPPARRGHGQALSTLPASRDEVASITALFPGARAFLGAEATEERVKAEGPKARLLHFACHGLIDERLPLESALALTPPTSPAAGGDNGLLQAWEIFERLRLDAELVTLSACETGLGQEMGGEGLIGLTRAFQFAGARSVLASLWKVSDPSTAELMRRFYGHLAAGRPKAEALRAAQLEMLSHPSGAWAHPFHWAAFQLSGDWR